jgi:hypothetical protein
MKRCKPSKLCKGVIKRCWGAWEYEKVRWSAFLSPLKVPISAIYRYAPYTYP